MLKSIVKTTEEFFYDEYDILVKKVTTVEEYQEENSGGSMPITVPHIYPFSPYPTWIGTPSYTTTTCELSTEEVIDGLFYMSNLIKNAQ